MLPLETRASPDRDWGYDVCDYYGVHPDLGTLDDLDELIAAAAGHGMKILLDLAPNHTSSAHSWFVDAASGRDPAHRGFHVWADPRPGGGPPTTGWMPPGTRRGSATRPAASTICTASSPPSPTLTGGKARLALLLLAMLPGTLILYYGDEIAMRDLAVPPALRRDHMTAGGEGRDHARTPMQWNGTRSAGFTAEGVRPWLPYGDNATRNVASQRDDPGSVLNLCRDLIAAAHRRIPGTDR
jgi:glycosidase